MSHTKTNATKREIWLAAAAEYELWATRVLDQERDAEVAARQLTFTSDGFDGSVLDLA